MTVTFQIIKAPRGWLTNGAQMTGKLEFTNTEKKPKYLEEAWVDIQEVWNDNNRKFGPKEKKYSLQPPLPRLPNESWTDFNMRWPAIQRRDGQVFHFGVHEHQILFAPSKEQKKVCIEPGKSQKWEFTFALPAQWLCKDRSGNWRFELQCCINKDLYLEPLIVPVEGCKAKPSFFFEPLASTVEPKAEVKKSTKGRGPPQKQPKAHVQSTEATTGYVGSFTVIPKGQKATLQLGKGEEDREYKISLQTPGTVRSGTEYKQIVDPTVLEGLMSKLDKITAALNVLRSLPPDDPARLKIEKAHEALKKFGYALFLQMIPEHLQEVIQNLTVALDFGLDESLAGYPWELLHDGTNFLCLKIPLGRYIAASSEEQAFKYVERGKRNGVRILLIVDPDGTLPGAH